MNDTLPEILQLIEENGPAIREAVARAQADGRAAPQKGRRSSERKAPAPTRRVRPAAVSPPRRRQAKAPPPDRSAAPADRGEGALVELIKRENPRLTSSLGGSFAEAAGLTREDDYQGWWPILALGGLGAYDAYQKLKPVGAGIATLGKALIGTLNALQSWFGGAASVVSGAGSAIESGSGSVQATVEGWAQAAENAAAATAATIEADAAAAAKYVEGWF